MSSSFLSIFELFSCPSLWFFRLMSILGVSEAAVREMEIVVEYEGDSPGVPYALQGDMEMYTRVREPTMSLQPSSSLILSCSQSALRERQALKENRKVAMAIDK